MPGYIATVIGENFEFIVDEEPQYLEFSRRVYVDAADETAAEQAAMALVREELLAQALLDDDADQLLSIQEICQHDVLADKHEFEDFVWYFPDEDEFLDE
jgi:hypothetical protein